VLLRVNIKKGADAFTNPPPGKADAKANAAPLGATKREIRRPSTDYLQGFFMSETTITAEKIWTYRATDYRLLPITQGDALIPVHVLSNFVATQNSFPLPQKFDIDIH
jgi:hypothetical protein